MKKSEMVLEVAKRLKAKDKCVTTNIEQCRYLAGIMVDAVLALGMLPPVLCDCGAEVCFEASVNTWEAESEEE